MSWRRRRCASIPGIGTFICSLRASLTPRWGAMRKQFPSSSGTSRYPNTVGAHSTLVVDYTELGREDEARAEAAEVLRISPEFSVDASMQIPFKDPAWRKRYYADLRKAGLK